MDVAVGFQIEEPGLLIPWGIDESSALRLFAGHPIHRVTDGYLVATCTSLGGLSHELGMHFRPSFGGKLGELEFFRQDYSDLAASYDEFQRHLVETFGQPTDSSTFDSDFMSHVWRLGGCEVSHYVFDRFGPEEHVRIRWQP